MDDLVVPVVIGRREERAGQRAAVDDLEVAFGRIDLGFGRFEEMAEVMREDVLDGVLLGVEGEPVGHGDVDGRGLHGRHAALFGGGRGGGGSLALDDGDEAVVLFHNNAGDVEEFVGAAGGAHGFGERTEAAVFGIKRDVVMGADVRAAVLDWREGAAAAFAVMAASPEIAALAAGLAFAVWFAFSAARGRRTVALGGGAGGAGGVAGGFAESAPVATWVGRASVSAAAVAAARAVVTALVISVSGAGVAAADTGVGAGAGVLRPLRAKAEALELRQIDLVESLGGFLGWFLVHAVCERGCSRGLCGWILLDRRNAAGIEAGCQLHVRLGAGKLFPARGCRC
ncbi:MAG: hypothetical protein LBK99_25060 [Opitutaceae bacterium]|nr:hypothetical protein [Opitutaceae bacterium]